MKDMIEAIKLHVLTKQQSWPTFDGQHLTRSNFLSASEAGSCIRKLGFSKAAPLVVHDIENEGIDPDHPDLSAASKYGYFERGHAVEAWIVKTLMEAMVEGEVLAYVGDDQVSLYSEELGVSGTPDGYYYKEDGTDWALLEFKSVGSMVMGPPAQHIRQVQVNMGLFRYLAEKHEEGPHAFIQMMGMDADVLCPEGELIPWTCARILYVESNNFFNTKMFEIEYDGGEEFIKACQASAFLFIDGQAADPADLAPEGKNEGGGACRFCDFKMQCAAIEGDAEFAKQMEGVEAPVKPALFLSESKDEALGQVIAALDEFLELRDEIKITADRKDALDKEVLRPFCERNGGAVDVYLADRGTGYSLRLANVSSMRLDKKLMVKAGLDPDDYSRESNYQRFDVKEVKQEAE